MAYQASDNFKVGNLVISSRTMAFGLSDPFLQQDTTKNPLNPKDNLSESSLERFVSFCTKRTAIG